MMCQALDAFQEKHSVNLEKVTQIPLEGEGTISKRVEKYVLLCTRLHQEPVLSSIGIDCTTA